MMDNPWIYRLVHILVGWDRIITRVLRELSYQPGAKIIDIGCGPGTLSPYFQSADYVGVDLSERYIEYAKEHREGRFYALPSQRVSELDEPFDLACVLGLFHHLSDQDVHASLQSLEKILRPGGRLVIVEAVWPTHWWDVICWIIRLMDRGDYVRSQRQWEELFEQTSWTFERGGVCRDGLLEGYWCTLTPPAAPV